MKKLTTFNSNGYLCNKRACCIVKHRSTKSSVYSKHHLQIDVNQTLKHGSKELKVYYIKEQIKRSNEILT